jgi:tRNA A-37 threonylcarbamoyl transferase component Bud32
VKASDDKTILMKFVRHYCIELHDICASSRYAPTLLAFERLPGSWYGVMMEYVVDAIPITEHRHISKHFKNWKTVLQELIVMFHNRDFVYGDLHDANIINSNDGCVRIADFNWGGRVREASYLTLKLNIELVDGRPLEDLRITKVDDL